jgi:mRNA interferase MazF
VVARGEVWWYEDPRAGRRPFCILTRDEAIPVLNQVLAVPATRTVRGIPTEVPLDEEDGMPAPCVLAADNLTLVRPALCTERITALDEPTLQAVCRALAAATACD